MLGTMNRDKAFFLSYNLSNSTPLYGNGAGLQFTLDKQMENSDSCNTMKWSFPNHAGSHIDAPRHFSLEGKFITEYPAQFWIFNQVEVVDVSASVTDCMIIEPNIFPRFKVDDPELVLIRTAYSRYRGTDRYTLTPPGISGGVAHWLREHYPSTRCVGMDLISVSSYSNRPTGRKAHQAFLNPESGEPILLLEDLNLDFRDHPKQVIVAPLQVEKADGSPCTVIGML